MKTRKPLSALVAFAAAALMPSGANAQEPEQQSAGPNDYANGATWLCRPGRQDACAVDLNTTVVDADGTLSPEVWSGDPSAPIDCFYVYPTVSTDPNTNSDMTPDAAEFRVIEQQFARFASICRPYAPSYRQVTLAGLMASFASGGERTLDQGLGYDDVRDAFHHYLEYDNGGRGFVLIGHSQGSYVLTRLIREEIEGHPAQNQMVSALLLGATVTVIAGEDTGGSFRNIPLCRSVRQTGCVITYVSFRSTAPPPQNTLFGQTLEPTLTAACTNPAALGGGSSGLHAYLSAGGTTIVGQRPSDPWVSSGEAIETPFVSVPGLLSAECTTNEHAKFLEITVHGNPSDARIDDIRGDLTPQWGLHLVDMNLAMGDLVGIVREQAGAWRGRGNQTPTIRQLAWVDRSGDVEGTIGPRMSSVLDPSISPDGSKVAVRGRQNQGETDHLWILEGMSANRITTNEGAERHMIWSPDGSRIAYSIQNEGGVSNLYIRASDGSGRDQVLIESEGMHKWYPSWSPDASTVVFHTNNPDTQARDLWYVSVASGETAVLVDDDGIQALARMSRDGRFVAYQSDQDNQMEIYVTTFPRSDARWKVSTNGGTWPKWSDDELFYWEGNSLMAAEFTTDGGFSPGTPRRLFTGEQVGMGADNMMTSYNPEYDVSADGTRFVVTQRLER